MKNVTVIETELRNSLPALAELINKELGFTPELSLRYSKDFFTIESDNLINELGNTLVRTMFASVNIRMLSHSEIIDNCLWFNPQLKYEHPNGGSNGTSFIWASVRLNLDTCTWVTGRSILNQNDEF